MVRLSVNINKVALLRNARGEGFPDLLKFARDCESFGAQGITIHPRPDQRHIRYQDVYDLKDIVRTEFNIEGYPSEKFVSMVCEVKPEQVTLVPDPPDALTSSEGWDTIKNHDFLQEVITEFKANNIRVSLFMEPIEKFIEGSIKVGAERIEFYTGPFAANYKKDAENAISRYRQTAEYASELGLGINAGHDLNLYNLAFLKNNLPGLQEVSIGHALISDALYYGIENTIQLYLRELE